MSPQAQQNELNFCYPLDFSKLKTDHLSLVPFNSNLPLFSSLYVSLTSTPKARTNFDWLPYGPFEDQKSFLAFYDHVVQQSAAVVWFAIIVKQSGADAIRKTKADDERADWESDIKAAAVDGGFFAGSVGFLNADVANARCETGHINILPCFQRTFVGTHTNGVLLTYLLEPESAGCLNLRRVEWFANSNNKRSIRAAERLGFRLEGVLRWHRVLPVDKQGPAAGGDDRGPARDSALLSICWDDWRDGVRGRVRGLLGQAIEGPSQKD